jgi:AraC family L-rhamnose operon regulatory protein RhaS
MRSSADILSYGYIENKLMVPHRNQGMEIVLVEHGHLEWAVDRIPEVLTPGTVFFTLPWQIHGSLMLREPPNRIFYTLFSLPDGSHDSEREIVFPSSLEFSEEEQKVLGAVFSGAQRHAWPATPLMKEIFPELIRRLDGETPMDAIAAPSLLRTLLIELAGVISHAQQETQWLSRTVKKVKDFLPRIAESMDHAWTLDEMADGCGIKRTQFTNIIKQLTGYSPGQYLQLVRFNRACELLRNTETSITGIAFECGYSSSQYFSEVFRKQARMTPSEYRETASQLDAIMNVNWDHPEQRSLAEEKKRTEMMHRFSVK